MAWTPETFAAEFLTEAVQTKPAILAAANLLDLSDPKATSLLAKAEATGKAFRWKLEGNRAGYATVPQPVLPLVTAEKTIDVHPDAPTKDPMAAVPVLPPLPSNDQRTACTLWLIEFLGTDGRLAAEAQAAAKAAGFSPQLLRSVRVSAGVQMSKKGMKSFWRMPA